MKSLVAVGLVLAAVTQSAAAAMESGYGALALGALVGSYSPILTGQEKAVLAGLLDGKALDKSSRAAIKIDADAVVCRAGDVDIATFQCELKFGGKKVELTGRHANELFATIGETGGQPDGAAGTIYEGLHAMRCVIDPAGIAQRDGGGATCSFSPGPP